MVSCYLEAANLAGFGTALQRQYTGFVPVAAPIGSWGIRLLIIGSSASIFRHSRELPAAMAEHTKKFLFIKKTLEGMTCIKK